MKLFTAVLIAAAIATQNAVIAQTTTSVPAEMTITPTTDDGMMMNGSMGLNSTDNMSGDMSDGDMSDGDSDMLPGSADNTTSEAPIASKSGSGTTMNAGGDTASSTSGAISIQLVTFTTSAVVAGLAAAFVF